MQGMKGSGVGPANVTQAPRGASRGSRSSAHVRIEADDQRHLLRTSHSGSDGKWFGCSTIGTHRYSALTDCTVQFVGMIPTPAVDETTAPFMNQIAVLPLVSRQSRSLSPSPL
jgi:hypothetical protein